MARIKSHPLYYDTIQNSWHLSSKSTKALTKKKVYWGAREVPLSITLGSKNWSALSSQYIRTKSFIYFRNKRPILGPLIGILTAKGKAQPFIGAKNNFIDITRTGVSKGAIVFVFTPEDIDWSCELIHGYLYHATHRCWRKCTFPIPNVIYNRIPNRSIEERGTTQVCLKRLKGISGLTLFNPHFFNKQNLIHILENNSRISQHIPKTRSLHSSTDIKEMLQSFPELYLKPSQGKAGAGIIKVKHDPNNHKYHIYYQQKKIQNKICLRSFKKSWGRISKLLIDSPYIIQQAIPLAKYEGSPFDVRTLVQKNREGLWEVSGIGIRVAGMNRITTHVPRGGRIEDPENVLECLFPQEKSLKIKEKIHQLAVSVAEELEEYYTKLGEMSIDIGIDASGSLWFFEANAKPMKFDEPDIRKKSLENIIHYAQYLTFDQPKGGLQLDAVAQSNV